MSGRALQINVAMLLAVACGFRVVEIETIAGLNGDEAYAGMQSYLLLHGGSPEWISPFGLPINPFYAVPQIVLQCFAEPAVWVLRAPAVLSGLALIPLTFVLVRRIADSSTAWVATIITAALPINIIYARIGLYHSQITLAALIAIFCSVRRRYVATGASFAAALVVHPTTVFLLPILLGPFVTRALVQRRSRGQSIRPVLATMFGVCLGVALLMALLFPDHFRSLTQSTKVAPAATAQDTRPPAWKRFTELSGWAELLLDYVRLLSGTTSYQYVAGSATGNTAMLLDIPTALLLAFILARGCIHLARRRDLDSAILLAGLAAALALLYVVAGLRAIEPHYERYSLFLIVPTIVIGSTLAIKSAGNPPGERRVLWVASLAGWLLLAGCWQHYFAFFHQTGGLSHRTFRTGRVEPKLAAWRLIAQHRQNDAPVVVMVSGPEGWTYWPMRYFSANAADVQVRYFRDPDDFTDWTDALLQGAYAVVFHRSDRERRVLEALKDEPFTQWPVRDYSGDVALVVIRVKNPVPPIGGNDTQ